MIQNYPQLMNVFFCTAGILMLLLLVYKNHIISVFDPLFIFLMTQAFSIELAFLQISNSFFLINFLLCQLFFVFGFFTFVEQKKPAKFTYKLLNANTKSLEILQFFSNACFLFIMIINIYLISKKGFALFTDDPTVAKVEFYTGGEGLGFIKRVNWGLLYLTGFIQLYLYLIKNKLVYLIMLLLLMVILGLSGSKGAMVFFLFAYTLFGLFNDVKYINQFKHLNTGKYILITIIFILSLFVIFNSVNNHSLETAFLGLGTRFLFFGDAIIYYYKKYDVRHFAIYRCWDFIPYEFNSILGFFRLTNYKLPLGFEMVGYKFRNSDSSWGPNVPFYVKGHIFFGDYGVLLYAFFVGGVIGRIRGLLYKIDASKKSLLFTLLIIFLNIEIYGFAQDSQLFISIIFDTFIFSVPFIILWYLYDFGATAYNKRLLIS